MEEQVTYVINRDGICRQIVSLVGRYWYAVKDDGQSNRAS